MLNSTLIELVLLMGARCISDSGLSAFNGLGTMTSLYLPSFKRNVYMLNEFKNAFNKPSPWKFRGKNSLQKNEKAFRYTVVSNSHAPTFFCIFHRFNIFLKRSFSLNFNFIYQLWVQFYRPQAVLFLANRFLVYLISFNFS